MIKFQTNGLTIKELREQGCYLNITSTDNVAVVTSIAFDTNIHFDQATLILYGILQSYKQKSIFLTSSAANELSSRFKKKSKIIFTFLKPEDDKYLQYILNVDKLRSTV